MKKVIAAACIFAPLLAQIGTAFALPANEYACNVQTTSLQTGLVMIQADDLASARRIAAERNATRLDGVKEQVKTVVECIDFPQARFADDRLQAFMDAMPL
jgi:hypothetical protein